MAGNLGGFFATLTLKSSAESFQKAGKDLTKIGDDTKKTGDIFQSFITNSIKGLLALGAASLGSAYAVSQIQGKMEITATRAGMGYTEFNKFSTALKLVGLDAGNVASKMAGVNSALHDYKVGTKSEALPGLAKNLALMGIDLQDFAKLSATQQVSLVAKKAESARGTDKEIGMRDLADEIMGIGDALMAIQQKGSAYANFAGLLGAGASSAWATNQSDVTKNSQAFNALTTQMDAMWKEFGEKMGNAFRPLINDLTNFIKNHKEEITFMFETLGTVLSAIAKALGYTVGGVITNAYDLQSRGDYRHTDLGKNISDQTKIAMGTGSFWGKGQIEPEGFEVQRAAEDYARQGKAFSAGVTAKDIASSGVPSQTTIGSITYNLDQEQLAFAVAQLKAGGAQSGNEAAQLAVLAKAVADKARTITGTK